MTDLEQFLAMLARQNINAEIIRAPTGAAWVTLSKWHTAEEGETGVSGDLGPSCEFSFRSDGELEAVTIDRGGPDYR